MAGGPFVPTFLRALPLARTALAYAAHFHREQRRESDAAPFVLHPLEVAAMLHHSGHPEPVVAAAILHDTVENTDAEPGEIRSQFGDEVADLVAALTEDGAIGVFEERKASLRRQVAEFGAHATAVYAADKVAKVRELRVRATHDRAVLSESEARRKLAHYDESLIMLEQCAAGHPLVRQLRFELEALRALPPRG